jgi:putative transposase
MSCGVTDLTEHPTREGKLYCRVVLDARSGGVVGWSIDSALTASPVASALGMAITNGDPQPRHSDPRRSRVQDAS